MGELDEIRARKLKELQQLQLQQNQEEIQRQVQLEQAMRQIDAIIGKFLTPEAQNRLSNLKLVDPDLVQKLKIYLAQLYSAGQIQHINDEQLKDILIKLKSAKRGINIKRI